MSGPVRVLVTPENFILIKIWKILANENRLFFWGDKYVGKLKEDFE
jgi:hypothetical protein